MMEYKVFDAHCDTIGKVLDFGGSITENLYNVDKNRMLEYKAYTQVFACFIAPDYYSRSMERFNALYNCYKAQDFQGITPILSIEGGEMIESIEDLYYLKECGVRTIALTWNNDNKIGGGVGGDGIGLTEFGKSVVRKMNELGILIDVSHLNDKTFYDVAKITDSPLIATHSNSREVLNHPRNLTDEMFKIIRDSGGVAGLNFLPYFISKNEKCTIDDMMRHINHFLDLDGAENIGIGTDFDGGPCLPEGINGVEDVWKFIEKIDKEYIDKISHKNFERVFGR